MAETISVAFAAELTTTVTFSGADDGNNTILVNHMDSSGTYTAASTVPVTKLASFNQALSGGAATIDLSALPGLSADETVNFSGLKVQFAKFRNKSTNANNITLVKGGSNGWCPISTTSWTVTLGPGQEVTLALAESSADVGSGAKEIDLTGTAAQILECFLVAG
jgi:hypothetical protein